jgi:hypothetical protein
VRSVFDRPTCCGVERVRLSPEWETGTPQSAEIASASAADWLKRRAQRRRQCKGTGTRASASTNSSRPARAIQRPHHRGKVEPVAVFKGLNQGTGDGVVTYCGSRAVVSRWIGDRFHRQQAASGIIGKGNSKPCAVRGLDERQLRPAWRAQARALAQRLAAGRTKRRQSEVQNKPQRRPHVLTKADCV